jgi:hypothetical protein
MKSLKKTISFFFLIGLAFNLQAVVKPFLTFSNPSIVGNKFRISIKMGTNVSTFNLGTNTISFAVTSASLANPVLISENFPAGVYGNTSLTTQSGFITSNSPDKLTIASGNLAATQINLSTTYLAAQNTNPLTVTTTAEELAIVEFDIIDINQENFTYWISSSINDINNASMSIEYFKNYISNFSLRHITYLNFVNPEINGNKFKVKLNMSSNLSFGLGGFNIRIFYNSTAVNNPKIISNYLPSPSFKALTTTGTSSTLFSINGVYNDAANLNIFPILTTGTDLLEVEFDIVDPNTPANFKFELLKVGNNARTVFIDDSKLKKVLLANESSLSVFNLNPPVNAGADVTLDCNNPTTTLTAADGGGSYLWSTGETSKNIVVSPSVTTTYSVTASNNTSDQVVVVFDCPPTLSSRVLLNQMANASLTAMPNFPLSSPYTNGAFNGNFTNVNNNSISVINSSILTTTGNNAIVDWLFLELRTGVSGATSVAYTKSALLQADGDIVDLDGTSSVKFSGVIPGDYYIAVRHHNSLGFRTANKIALSSTLTSLDFTNPTALHGATPLVQIAPNVYTMIGGDANSDGSIDAFDTIVWELQNGLFDDYTQNADYNMDGSIDAFDSIIWELNNGNYQELD